MSGIAEVLVNMGYKVTGSDLRESPVVQRLRQLGAEVTIGHASENVADSNCVVYSSAVSCENPEMVEAGLRQIPVIPRAEMLAELMRLKYGIVVAGTHGKTTTTSLIAAVLGHAGIDPTIVTGGKINSLGANARLGTGEFLVAEADESDGSFIKLTPTLAVVTNIDREHMDHYADFEEVKSFYLDFINKVPFYGCAVICLDHPVLQGLVPDISRRIVSYGLTAQADVHAENVEHHGVYSTFDVVVAGKLLGKVRLNLPGLYNVYNSLAAVAVALDLDVEFDQICAALEDFRGVGRRFEVKGTASGIMVVDDYGHHPVEVKAVLKAAKDGWSKKTIVAFQPHRYSRTEDQLEEFSSAFNDADTVILTEIYAAGEEPIEGITGERLYNEIRGHGHRDIIYVPELKDVATTLMDVASEGDMVLTLGAGSINTVADEFYAMLAELEKEAVGGQ